MAKFTKWFGGLFSNAGGYALGSATADALRPGLQEVVNEAWSIHPAVPLPAQTAAQAEIVGALDAAGVRAEARAGGLNTKRTDALRALAGQAPGFANLAALRNRDLITDAQFERGLGQLGIRAEWRDDARQLRFGVLDAGTLAQLVARGQLELDVARNLAEADGTTAATFARMVAAATSAPTVDQVLELGNRRGATDEQVAADLEATGLRGAWRERVAGLRRYLLPPSDVIRLAVHEVYDPAKREALDLDAEFPSEFAARAARLGISEPDARDLWAGHWDLPSYTQGTEMLFRGEINQAEFEGLLAALDYAPTWRDKLATIARRIPTISDMIRFAQREVYSPAQREQLGLDADYPEQFTAQAAKHGLSEQDARDYWAAHWRLPSATQGYRMLWRDEISAGELDGLLKALDYPAKWRDRLANIAYLVPGRIDIRRMLSAGLRTPEQAQTMYEHLGYTPDDAALMVRLARATETSTSKDLSREDLTAEYEGLYIDRATYLAALEALGYSESEAAALAGLADARRVKRARAQFESRIHAQFVAHKIDRPAAEAALTKTGIATAARERILTEWDNEKEVNVRRLTQAQIVKSFKKATMTRELALDALTDQGLPEGEANILLDNSL